MFAIVGIDEINVNLKMNKHRGDFNINMNAYFYYSLHSYVVIQYFYLKNYYITQQKRFLYTYKKSFIYFFYYEIFKLLILMKTSCINSKINIRETLK